MKVALGYKVRFGANSYYWGASVSVAGIPLATILGSGNVEMYSAPAVRTRAVQLLEKELARLIQRDKTERKAA
ncbi:MAG TPA: hypothetical protein VI756_11465 [Blastocatellia bacterium]